MSDPQYTFRDRGRRFATQYASWFYYDVLTDLSARLDALEAARPSAPPPANPVPSPAFRLALANDLLTMLDPDDRLFSERTRDDARQSILHAFERLSPTK